ncbi:MAG: UPF0309 protein [Armatimonadota bacterium]|nr:MAG: UPF0309 protein [Armatimonadota bacterium]
MVALMYLDRVRELLDFLGSTQMEQVNRAADLVVQALRSGGAVFCHNIGHGTEGDFINRAGGLAAVQRFSFAISLQAPLPDCIRQQRSSDPDSDLARVRFAVSQSPLKAGDVMLLSSVSGRSRQAVEMALACQKKGVSVIALVSKEYSSRVESQHPSGKKLGDAADIVLDIGVPYGDACVDVPGLEVKAIPLSGVAMTVLGWMLWGTVMEKMAAEGDPPTVFVSVNRPEGPAHYEQCLQRYNERGY